MNPDDEDANDDAEDDLVARHGMTINFQLYRADHTQSTRLDMHGPRLGELTIQGAEISGSETVASVKKRVLPRLLGDRSAQYITLLVSNREMKDDGLFYADHFLLLPCWIQVVLSDIPFADVVERMKRLTE